MDRKGVNTFPFYKFTSRTERQSHKKFCCAFVLSMLENIKDGGDSCFRDISRTSVKQSVPDPPITELATLLGTLIKVRCTLGIVHNCVFNCLNCLLYYCGYCLGSSIDPNPDLGDTFLESSNKIVRELCGVYRHG